MLWAKPQFISSHNSPDSDTQQDDVRTPTTTSVDCSSFISLPCVEQPACHTIWRAEEQLSPRIQFMKKAISVLEMLKVG